METEKPFKILLVEDDWEDYLLCREMLSESRSPRFQVEWNAVYQEALEAMCANCYDAYLVDYRLGSESGLDLMREALEKGCTKPIIILTGQGDYEIDAYAAEMGAADYLVKGQISPHLLERSLRYSIQHKKTETSLRNSQKNLQSIFDRMEDFLFIVDYDAHIIRCNPMVEERLGYEEKELLGTSVLHLHPPEMYEQAMYIFSRIVTGRISSCELPLVAKSGELIPVETKAAHILWEGKKALSCISRDISERLAMEARLSFQATHDALTNLPNRYVLEERVQEALYQAYRESRQVGLAYINVDHFKDINETLGHHIGDELLKQIAQRFMEHKRPEDTLARMGNDEFALVLIGLGNTGEALQAIHAMRSSLEHPFLVEGRELYITVSVGVGVYPDESNSTSTPDATTLLRNANMALDSARIGGRNNLRVFEETMQARALERLELTNRLRRAITQGEFRLFYQPQIQISTCKVVGLEALLRWQHPDLGMISPNNFIPVVEESGLIVPLGEWVLREACSQLNAWKPLFQKHLHAHTLHTIRMGVNVSPLQFMQRDFASQVLQALREYDLSAHEFAIEVTENVFMENVDEVAAHLSQLRRAGVEVHIDDFGTAYSSLAYLQSLPVDYVKIDHTFLQHLRDNHFDSEETSHANVSVSDGGKRDIDHSALVKSIIAMAHSLQLKVIAEGVETHAQLLALRSLFCDQAQGYLSSVI